MLYEITFLVLRPVLMGVRKNLPLGQVCGVLCHKVYFLWGGCASLLPEPKPHPQPFCVVRISYLFVTASELFVFWQ